MAEDVIAKQEEAVLTDELTKDMVDVGLFYGRKKNRTNPKMKNFILGNRNEIEIINLAKTKEQLEKSLAFIKDVVRQGKLVLFVGTQPAAQAITSFKEEFSFPVVATRWLGGTLTNFKVISKRLEYYLKLRSDWAANLFAKYTKKERLIIERELRRLDELLNGIEHLKNLPGAVVVIDPRIHDAAVREAKILKIPVVSLINTDGDPDFVTYPVPGNNKSKSSIEWFLDKVRSAVREGKTLAAAEPQKDSKENKKETEIR